MRVFQDLSLESDNMRGDCLFETLIVDVVDGNRYSFTFVADLDYEIGSLQVLDFLLY